MNELRGALWFQRGVGLLACALITYVLVIPFAFSLLQNFDRPAKSVHALDVLPLPAHILLKGSEAITVLAVFALGCSIGSFLNVVVYRLPLRQSLIFERSHCPSCNHAIAGRDNVPLIGWLMLNGRCRNCEQPISSRYPIVELVTGSLFVLLLFVQLLSGGANIPVRTPNQYTGFVWIIFYTKWDLVGLYLYHCYLLCTVFTWSLIAVDKNRIPLYAIIISLLYAVLPAVVWPALHPIATAQIQSQKLLLNAHWLGLQDSLVGLLTGFGLGIAFSRLYPAQKNYWIATTALLGAVLGWSAVVSVLLLFSILHLVSRFVQKKQLLSRLSISVGFFLVLILHHLFWNLIHGLEMYCSDLFASFASPVGVWLQAFDFPQIAKPFGAGMCAAFACGIGVCPLFVPQLQSISRLFNGYAYASGAMLATSLFSLLWPAWSYATTVSEIQYPVLQILTGLGLGCLLIWLIKLQLGSDASSSFTHIFGSRTAVLVFISMTIHSAPEGWAVGAAYAAEQHHLLFHNAGLSIALAIALHNIPEGLVVAIPMRAQGLGFSACFCAAFLSSLPQPLAAIPACFAIWKFQPLLLPALSIAAGAMIYLIFSELLPQAARQSNVVVNTASFTLGILTLLGIQFVLN